MLKESSCGCDSQSSGRYYTLTVQSPAGTAGADGHIDYTSDANWTDEGTIRAKFTSRAGREFVSAKQVRADQGSMLETVSTNFTRGILPKWRLKLDTRRFEILAAYDVNEERRIVQIEVKETK
jgi:SPP1 family predicted phage head-tail adaptor